MEVEAERYGRPILRLGCDHATEKQSARTKVSPGKIQRVLEITNKHGQRFPGPA
jgi:hypothetical protein